MINTYRMPARLYVKGAPEPILSQEGTTQGDVQAMCLYSCATMPSKRQQQQQNMQANGSSCKEVWYADDSAAGGKIEELRCWWDSLLHNGPRFGYHTKPSKTWMIVKPECEEKAKQLFEDVNITATGHIYLRSFIGTEEGVADFMKVGIEKWSKDVRDLSRIPATEPQLAYAAFVFGISKKFFFFFFFFFCITRTNVSFKII